MTRLTLRLTAVALLSGAATLSMAASSTSSAASDSIGASVGSVSGSFQKSSDSSSRTTTAEGDYKIIEMAAAPDRPGMLRLKLQAFADRSADGEFFLILPQEVVAQTRLAPGGIVTAHQRPYGTEFAQGEPQQAFYLVLSDEWYRELQTRPVVL